MTRIHDAIQAWRDSIAHPRQPLWFVLHDSLPLAWPSRTARRLPVDEAAPITLRHSSANGCELQCVLCVLLLAAVLMLYILHLRITETRALTGSMPAKTPAKRTDQYGRHHLPSIDLLFGDDTVWPATPNIESERFAARSRARRVRRRRSRGGERPSLGCAAEGVVSAAEEPYGLVRSRSLSRVTSRGSLLPSLTNCSDDSTQRVAVEVPDTQVAVAGVPDRLPAVAAARPAAPVVSIAADAGSTPSPVPVPMATADLLASPAERERRGSPHPTSHMSLTTGPIMSLHECICIPSTMGYHDARLDRVRHLVAALGPPQRLQRARLRVIPSRPPRASPTHSPTTATMLPTAASRAINHAEPQAAGAARGGGAARAYDSRLCHAFIASDRDKSGALSKRECYHALALVGLHYTPSEHLHLWQRCHLNFGGQVEWYEFRALGAALLSQAAAMPQR